MDRREFLVQSGASVLSAAALASCRRSPKGYRLLGSESHTAVERAAVADATALLARAFDGEPSVDVLVGTPGSLDVRSRQSLPSTSAPGAYRITIAPRRVVIAGTDPEGARNGLYRFLEHLGFGFFRDGVTTPSVDFEPPPLTRVEESPRFRFRGDMIWDNYLGPRRYCAAMWGDAEWEQALLFMARSRMNFLEVYPPLERVLALAFPAAVGLDDGAVWKAEAKHALAQRVLARGRELGLQFMYVLSYGAFPEPIRRLYPELEWRGGFLCAHQPELEEMTERVWRTLVDELGTDHWYAIRHRGEEEQSYSDPCRSVTKAEGFLQAFSVLERVDSEARPTVWTWGETLPDLFERFPENVRAVHIRHGMANVFGDRGEGREQPDGRPPLPGGRSWLSGQFTVFGANETLVQTAWSDAASLSADASASADDTECEGYFQWPEWSDTSPWLSHVIARLSWSPGSLADVEASFMDYAERRHHERAPSFVRAFLPLLREGNARWTYPPRKRLVVPFALEAGQLALLARLREGAGAMIDDLAGAQSLFERDWLDLLAWVGRRQAEAFEARAVVDRDEAPLDEAEATWSSLAEMLGQAPELSLIGSLRGLDELGPLSEGLVDALWRLGCDFYNGYPLVLSKEAIELVYRPQLEALRELLRAGRDLDPPGWFWHDFPDPAWAGGVRKLPSEDAGAFEKDLREHAAAALGSPATRAELDPGPARRLLAIPLPPPLSL